MSADAVAFTPGQSFRSGPPPGMYDSPSTGPHSSFAGTPLSATMMSMTSPGGGSAYDHGHVNLPPGLVPGMDPAMQQSPPPPVRRGSGSKGRGKGSYLQPSPFGDVYGRRYSGSVASPAGSAVKSPIGGDPVAQLRVIEVQIRGENIYQLREEDVSRAFGRYGNILTVVVGPEPHIALVEFDRPDVARYACSKLNGRQLKSFPGAHLAVKVLGLPDPSQAVFSLADELANSPGSSAHLTAYSRTTGQQGFPNSPSMYSQATTTSQGGGYYAGSSSYASEMTPPYVAHHDMQHMMAPSFAHQLTPPPPPPKPPKHIMMSPGGASYTSSASVSASPGAGRMPITDFSKATHTTEVLVGFSPDPSVNFRIVRRVRGKDGRHLKFIQNQCGGPDYTLCKLLGIPERDRENIEKAENTVLIGTDKDLTEKPDKGQTEKLNLRIFVATFSRENLEKSKRFAQNLVETVRQAYEVAKGDASGADILKMSHADSPDVTPAGVRNGAAAPWTKLARESITVARTSLMAAGAEGSIPEHFDSFPNNMAAAAAASTRNISQKKYIILF